MDMAVFYTYYMDPDIFLMTLGVVPSCQSTKRRCVRYGTDSTFPIYHQHLLIRLRYPSSQTVPVVFQIHEHKPHVYLK